MRSIGPKLIEVPRNIAYTSKPKLVDFTLLDLYPSKYQYIDGKVKIKSLILEDIARQAEILKRMNTNVMLGDKIKVDIKFGHFLDNKWIDLYVKGIFKVKRIIPRPTYNEVLFLVTECSER